jgi:hypothetical protein
MLRRVQYTIIKAARQIWRKTMSRFIVFSDCSVRPFIKNYINTDHLIMVQSDVKDCEVESCDDYDICDRNCILIHVDSFSEHCVTRRGLLETDLDGLFLIKEKENG